MRKYLAIALAFVVTLCAVAAIAATPAKIRAYISELEGKLTVARSQNNVERIQLLENLISQQKQRLALTAGAAAPSQASGVSDDNLAELKEEVNTAIASLNSQIKGVESKVDKGATVAGRAYISWLLKDQLNKTYNHFDIGRVYLDFKKSLDKDCAVRLTTDITRQDSFWNDDVGGTDDVNAEDALIVYLKYAYFEMGNLGKHWDIPYVGLDKLRVGQQATHWIDFMQSQWKFRYVAKTLTDHYKMFSSADIGLGAFGSVDLSDLMIPYVGRFEYHSLLIGGSGYKDPESSGKKDFQLTVKTEPVRWGKKDVVTAAVGLAVEDIGLQSLDTGSATKKGTAMVSYAFSKPAKGIVFAEYANQLESDSGGSSVGGQYEVLPATNAFARYDSWKSKKGDGKDYAQNILGVEYNWGKNVKIALDYQHETKNSADSSKKLAIHTRVKW